MTTEEFKTNPPEPNGAKLIAGLREFGAMLTDEEKGLKVNDMKPKLHSGRMEVAVAMLLNYRVYTIVPNVSWGLGLAHECDLLALDKQGRFTEIEIKISKSDLKADFAKWHGHKSKIISRLVYAVPIELLELAESLVPKGAGIITVDYSEYGGFRAKWQRQCRHNENRPSQNQIKTFMELGCMRIWSLKSALYNKS